MISVRTLLVSIINMAVPIAPCVAQQLFKTREYEWAGWHAYWENDAFYLNGDRNSDRYYTNGVRFTLTQHSDKTPRLARKMREHCWICPARWATDSASVTSTLVLGQNMFTPESITSFAPDPDDRPFAGYLYAGVQSAFSGESVHGWEHLPVTLILDNSVEISVGFLGPMSLAGGVQAGVHVLRKSSIPKGWHTQLGTEPTVQLLHVTRLGLRTHPGSNTKYFDWLPEIELTPHLVGALGTVQVFGSWGGTFRAGWNLTGLAQDVITYNLEPSKRPRWELAVVYTRESRHFAHNVFLDGGFLGETPEVARRSTVTDKRVGFELRADPLTLSYRRIERSPEMLSTTRTHPSSHRFGSFSLSYAIGYDPHPVGACLRWFLEHLAIEVGFGMGITKSAGPTTGGRAARAAIGPSLGRWGVSVDFNGVVREPHHPDANGIHTDAFHNSDAVSLWWAPWETLGPGFPILRLGLGDAVYKTQRLGRNTREDMTHHGHRVLLGIGYEFPLSFSEQLGLGVDFTWSRVPFRGTASRTHGSFLATVIGLKWRPVFD